MGLDRIWHSTQKLAANLQRIFAGEQSQSSRHTPAVVTCFAVWLPAAVVAVGASYPLTTPLWVTLELSATALLLIALLADISQSNLRGFLKLGRGPAPMGERFDSGMPKKSVTRHLLHYLVELV